jgi:hypothetical protein
MTRISISTPGFVRSLCLAAAAVFALSTVPMERAAAMSPINPGLAPSSATGDLMIQVRGGGGGHGGGGGGHFGGGGGGHFGGGGGAHFGGGHFGAAHIGGGHFGGARFGGGGWRGARVAHFGGYRYGGFHRGYRFARFHHHRRFFYGGYYPYYYHHRCRIVWTYYGPRRVCWHHHWHRWHRYY